MAQGAGTPEFFVGKGDTLAHTIMGQDVQFG